MIRHGGLEMFEESGIRRIIIIVADDLLVVPPLLSSTTSTCFGMLWHDAEQGNWSYHSLA